MGNALNPYMVKIGASGAGGTFPTQAIHDMGVLGIGGVFYQIPWVQIDTSGGTTQNTLPLATPPSYVWTAWDSCVSQCNGAGIDVYLAIMGGSPGVPTQFRQADGTAQPSYMANFARQIAAAYTNGSAVQRGTRHIAGIYCGNEDYSKGGSGGLPASLVAAMKVCYPAIKSVNPNMTVIAGGLFTRNSTTNAAWWQTLINRSTGAYDGSGKFQADAVSFHWHDALPVDSSGNPVELDPAFGVPSWNNGQGIPSFAQTWQIIQTTMAAQHPPLVVDVWGDEIGMNVNTNPGGLATPPDTSRNPGSVLTEAQRMTYFTTILNSCRDSGIVKKIGFFTLGYFQGTAPNYTGSSLRDGQSLVQGPTDGTPSYGATFYGIQSYISQNRTWGSGSGGGGGGGGGGSGTPITLTMPLASRFGMNYYHESMGYFGGSYSGVSADLAAIGPVTKNIKIYHNPLPQNAGTVSRATSLTLCQNISVAAKAAGFYVVWVENIDQGQVLTDSTTDLSNPAAYKWKWSDYSAQVLVDAASAQVAGADEFLVGNEIQGSGHFYSVDPGTHVATTIYTGTNFPPFVKGLVSACKATFAGLVGYQEGHSVSGNWVTTGLGSLDKIYFDPYDEWNIYESKVQSFATNICAKVAIGETSAIDVRGRVGSYVPYTEDDWTRELMRRYDFARQLNVPVYPFTYGDPSSNGYGFTTNHTTYHDVWNYISSSKVLGYTQYFRDTFPPNDFVGGSGGTSGELDVDGTHTLATAPTPGTDFVYRGACIGYTTTGGSSFRLVVRYTDTNNYYALNVNLSTQVVSFLRRQSGVETILGVPITWPPRGSFTGGLNPFTLYDFEIRVQGTGASTQVAAFFNTYKLCDQVDSGNTGLNAKTCGLLYTGLHAGIQNVVLSSFETASTGSGGGGGGGGGSGSGLTTYFTGEASSTLGTANTLYTASGGAANTNAATTLGVATDWGELYAQGTAGVWPGLGTAPTPSGHGFFLDTNVLDGQQLLAGPVTVALRLNMIGTGAVTVTADLHTRLYRYTPGTTTYFPILDCILAGQSIKTTKTVFALSGSMSVPTPFATGDRLYIDLPARVIANTGPPVQQIQLCDLSTETGALTGLVTAEVSLPGFVPYTGGGGGGGGPSVTPTALGADIFGLARLGDGSMTKKRSYYATLPISYRIAASKYSAPMTLSYTIMRANVASLLLYYLIAPTAAFAINGDSTIIVPDRLSYAPRPVTARTILAEPIIQGYQVMTWQYTTIEPQRWAHLVSYYNPQNPLVLLTYPDETGTWVQREVRMMPPVWGTWETVIVSGASLSFVIPSIF